MKQRKKTNFVWISFVVVCTQHTQTHKERAHQRKKNNTTRERNQQGQNARWIAVTIVVITFLFRLLFIQFLLSMQERKRGARANSAAKPHVQFVCTHKCEYKYYVSGKLCVALKSVQRSFSLFMFQRNIFSAILLQKKARNNNNNRKIISFIMIQKRNKC